jgi:hypothetical protein
MFCPLCHPFTPANFSHSRCPLPTVHCPVPPVFRTRSSSAQNARALRLLLLTPSPTSCPSQTLAIAPRFRQSAHTPCFGRHPGFKFIHKWRKRSAHKTDTEKTKTQSKSDYQNHGSGVWWVGWGLEAGRLHPVPCSKASRVVPICRRFDCICRSARSVVMPNSETSSASGDEISTTISWNSGVLMIHSCMRRNTL